MPGFSISKRTRITPDELIAAFVDAVAHPDSASKKLGSIEGTIEAGVMRWRERSLESESGDAQLGHRCEARAQKQDGVLTIRAKVTTPASHWIGFSFGTIACLALFMTVTFVSPGDWHGPKWVAWLLPVGAVLFAVGPFWSARSIERRARGFLEGLINDAEDGRQSARQGQTDRTLA